ncbi:MAG: sulfite exporter TauE/SafE family protein [Campylobacterota bacterium]
MLAVFGITVGFISGFFGVGGGFVLVPMLLIAGFDMKTAIGISVMQMVFSSIYGSFLNYKNGSLKINDSLIVGIGGGFGALFSGLVLSFLSEYTLKVLFVVLVGAAIAKMLRPLHEKQQRSVHPALLFSVGAVTGTLAISLGVGGSVLIVPILVGVLYYPVKKAVSAGLFFVVFSSVFGLISLSLHGHVDYTSGLIVGLFSLIGVTVGIKAKDKVSDKLHKRYILLMYTIIFLYMTGVLFE